MHVLCVLLVSETATNSFGSTIITGKTTLKDRCITIRAKDF